MTATQSTSARRRARSLLVRGLERADRLLVSAPWATGTFVAVFLVSVAFRFLFWWVCRGEEVRPFSFDPFIVSFPGFVGWGYGDVQIALVAAVIVGLVEHTRAKALGAPLALGLVAGIAILCGVHVSLFLAMHTGLTWAAIVETASAPSVGEVVDGSDPRQVALVIASVLGVTLIARVAHGWRRTVFVATLVVVAANALSMYARPEGRWVAKGLRPHAAFFVADEIRLHHLRDSIFDTPFPVSAEQALQDGFVDNHFGAGLPQHSATPAPLSLVPGGAPPQNVLLIVMESTGFSYISTPKPDGAPLMPRLKALADSGVSFLQHRSPANSSASALMSLFTGLHPVPERTVFAIRKDAVIPGLPALWRADSDGFLVTPGRLESFFPRPMLRAAGVTDQVGFYDLPERFHGEVQTQSARDERTTALAFRERLRTAKAPFYGVYYTYAPHYFYLEYGEKYHVFTGGTKLDSYLNNLVLLDEVIGGIVDELAAAGRRDDTLIVIVGDHGEAFGQHAGNWGHSRKSYEENFRVPLVLVHPSLTKTTVSVQTSHVDIPPTILAILGKPIAGMGMQGRSLLEPVPTRRIFAWGNEGTLTTWRPTEDGGTKKVQLSVNDDSCRRTILESDPDEKAWKKCGAKDQSDIDAILAWRSVSLGVKRRASARAAHGAP